jgi:transposase
VSDDRGAGGTGGVELGCSRRRWVWAGPWRVSGAEFDDEAGRLDLSVVFDRGTRFACPEPGCGQDRCAVHDTLEKSWRHLDFFQHKAFLHARVPRVRCPEHGVRLVAVPWARPGSGFTMLFEALVVTFAKAMPMKRVEATVREHDTRVWRIVEHHVHTARAGEDFSGVRVVGMVRPRPAGNRTTSACSPTCRPPACLDRPRSCRQLILGRRRE